MSEVKWLCGFKYEFLSTFFFRSLRLAAMVLVWIPAMILALPFLMITDYIAKKKAEEALKKSDVKIAGRDVLGTWKVLCAMFLIPTLHILYTFLVYLCLDYAMHDDDHVVPDGSLSLLGTGGKAKYAVVFFFFMPFLSYYNFIWGENVIKVARSLYPLFLVIRGQSIVKDLVELRKECVEKTTYAVDSMGFGRKFAEVKKERIRGGSKRIPSLADMNQL